MCYHLSVHTAPHLLMAHRCSTFLTNRLISCARSSGSSKAAKCPPRGMQEQTTMFLNNFCAQERGLCASSWGKAAMPVGTYTPILKNKQKQKNPSCQELFKSVHVICRGRCYLKHLVLLIKYQIIELNQIYSPKGISSRLISTTTERQGLNHYYSIYVGNSPQCNLFWKYIFTTEQHVYLICYSDRKLSKFIFYQEYPNISFPIQSALVVQGYWNSVHSLLQQFNQFAYQSQTSAEQLSCSWLSLPVPGRRVHTLQFNIFQYRAYWEKWLTNTSLYG